MPYGQFVTAAGQHVERVRAVHALVLQAVAGVAARQAAQCQEPRHEAQLRVRVTRADELRHLVERREVARLASGRQLAAGAW